MTRPDPRRRSAISRSLCFSIRAKCVHVTAASAPASASAPTAASTPAVSGEQLPSLSSPQTGSTAATGNGVEGMWTTSAGIGMTTAFIDSLGDISDLDSAAGFALSQFFGVIAAAASTWTRTSGWAFISGHYYPTTTGSGTFTANQTFTGSYVENGSTATLSWVYDPANALAVTQSRVAGTWAQTGASPSSLTIANDGTLTGTLTACPVTGTLLLATPSSGKNLYTMSVTGTGTSCTLQSGTTYSGNAAIKFLAIAGSSLYARTIFFLIKSANNSAVAYGQLKQQ